MREDAAVTDPFAPPSAGTPAPVPPVAEPPPFGDPVPVGRNNGLGTAALVLGIASIPFCWLVLPGVLAVIFGFIARGRAKRGQASNGGVALAGIITGVVGLLLSAVLIMALIRVATSPAFGDYNDCYDAAQTTQQESACLEQLVDELLD